MYKFIRYSILLFLLIGFISCGKDPEDVTDDNCMKVTFISEVCGTAVMQITSSAHKNLSLESWIVDGKTYPNTFYTVISCSDFDFLNKLGRPTLIGAEFKAKIIKGGENGSCVRCLAAIANPPKIQFNINLLSEDCKTLGH